MNRKIKIYNSFEEQEQDEISFLSSLSLEERLNLFFRMLKLSQKVKQNHQIPINRKIEIRYDNRFW